METICALVMLGTPYHSHIQLRRTRLTEHNVKACLMQNVTLSVKMQYQWPVSPLLLLLCVYIALYRLLGKTLKCFSDNLFLFALFSSISGPLLGLYLLAAIAVHIQNARAHACQVLFYLNEAPPFCLHGSTVRDLSLTSASCLRESVLQNMNFIFEGTEIMHIQYFYSITHFTQLLHHNYVNPFHHNSYPIHQCYYD